MDSPNGLVVMVAVTKHLVLQLVELMTFAVL